MLWTHTVSESRDGEIKQEVEVDFVMSQRVDVKKFFFFDLW